MDKHEYRVQVKAQVEQEAKAKGVPKWHIWSGNLYAAADRLLKAGAVCSIADRLLKLQLYGVSEAVYHLEWVLKEYNDAILEQAVGIEGEE